MKRNKSHSGLMVQIFILFLFIPALIIISRAKSKTSAARSSLELAQLSAAGEADKNNSENDDLKYTLSESSFPSPEEGHGGPILVIGSADNPFSRYTVEILRAEGLNEFAAEDISSITLTTLENYDVLILGEMTIDEGQVNMLTNWVNAGGTLIAFKPCPLLLPLLGLSPVSGTLSDKYLLVDTTSGPGAGIVNQTIQFHGQANLHKLNGATSLAAFYSTSFSAMDYPAVTTINIGNKGGKAVAFTYDLPRSIVYTRQGNPKWAGQKRDGEIDPIRSDDLFYPDWLDFNKVTIPQADEQQRLLANIILLSNLHRKPLPRFWYLPRDLKAAIVMTGDNHTTNGTTGRFYQYLTLGPNSAQDIADWKAVRATSYIYPDMPITSEQAIFFQEQGFEISLHTNTGCTDYTQASLKKDFNEELKRFSISYPGIFAPVTNRSHCLNWSDWSSTPKVELSNGIRLDATYYYWPESWMKNRPGMFTGSGMPMRFADMNGSLIDVYQMPTQMTDETNMNYSAFCNELLDKAIGPEGYYGIFCANMHTDHKYSEGSDAIIASAQARNVPVVSAKQMLTWLDGRNNSFFSDITWSHNQLNFSVTAQNGANNLKAMLPLNSETGSLVSVTYNGNSIPFTLHTIKGIQYAFFAPVAGSAAYAAIYEPKKNDGKESKKMIQNQPKDFDKTTIESSGGKLYVSAMPNPAISYFNLIINSNDADPVTVKISDLSGRIIETHEKVASTGILRIGDTWIAGTYIAEIIQGEQKKLTKIIKMK
jgi:hypothetical protein